MIGDRNTSGRRRTMLVARSPESLGRNTTRLAGQWNRLSDAVGWLWFETLLPPSITLRLELSQTSDRSRTGLRRRPAGDGKRRGSPAKRLLPASTAVCRVDRT